MKMFEVSNPRSPKREWTIEITREEIRSSLHNHDLYLEMIGCTSVSENIRGLLLVAEAIENEQHEDARQQIFDLHKQVTGLVEDLRRERLKTERLAYIAGAEEYVPISPMEAKDVQAQAA